MLRQRQVGHKQGTDNKLKGPSFIYFVIVEVNNCHFDSLFRLIRCS